MKLKINYWHLVSVLCISFISVIFFGSKAEEFVTAFLPFVGPLIAVQIASLSLVVGLMDKEIVERLTTDALRILKELIEEFGDDSKKVLRFGVIVFVLSFCLKNHLVADDLLVIGRFLLLVFLVSIFSIVFESIGVIMKIWNLRIDLINKKSKK